MRLTVKERKKVTAIMAPRYQKARKKDKGVILNEFIELTGYDRRYASYVLRSHGRRVRINETTVVQGDLRKRIPRNKPKVYDAAVEEALRKIWYIMDCICGKRLAPILREIVKRLERFREITLSDEVTEKLFTISSSSIDRVLAKERKQHQIKGRGHTKPGTLLKHQIPIRTFSEWNEKEPGFVEIDLVGHDGGDSHGDFAENVLLFSLCSRSAELSRKDEICK